ASPSGDPPVVRAGDVRMGSFRLSARWRVRTRWPGPRHGRHEGCGTGRRRVDDRRPTTNVGRSVAWLRPGWARRVSLDQAAAQRLGDRGGPVRCPELLEDVLEV